MKFLRALLYVTVCGALVIGCTGAPPDPMHSLKHARVLDEPVPVGAFRLSSQHGRPFDETRLRGTWSVLFAGFTHCPDICPTTLALLASVQKRADIAPDRLRVVFVSVDPDRDTPEHLATYLAHFDSDWTALTGPLAEIDRLLDSLGMAYVRVPTGGGDYTMDHSTALALIDPQGRMRGFFAAPLDADELVEDLGRIAAAPR